MRIIIIAVLLIAPVGNIACYGDGLDSLIEVGKSQAAIQKEYAAETKVFDEVKRGIDSGAIQKGQSGSDIKDKYGDPVVVVKDYPKKRDKWVYKPASSSFDKGPKISLYFDANGILDEIEVRQ